MTEEKSPGSVESGQRAVEERARRAKKELKKEVRAQAKEIEKAIDEA